MVAALAQRAIEPCTCGVLGQRAERERVAAQARELSADGVVCHYLRGCAPVAGGQAAVVRALREAGLPALMLETDASEEDVENLRTRIEAFIELLAARG
jgi:benzoyl-CoA reductase/2-hydroxyglutaryl-CoA dehydratase subunit BcrC/BadD/HgdB